MASDVCTSLGLSGKDLTGKLVHVAERHGSDVSFVLGSLMWKVSKSDASLCLLALHNPRTHHQHVAKRLGHDLQSATVLEPYIMYSGEFARLDMASDDNLRRLFLDVKASLGRLTGKKCLVIDDLSDLLCMGASVAQALAFLQYCRTLMDEDVTLTVVVGTHYSEDNEAQRVVANGAAHLADCRVTVAALQTGFSSTVTGTVTVDDRMFHYRLSDRHVKVFAPGTAGVM